MKRMMIAAMLLLGSVSVFAADEKCEVELVAKEKVEKRAEESCTVTVDGTLKLMGTGFQISCSATSEKGCREALKEARSCVAELKKSLLSLF